MSVLVRHRSISRLYVNVVCECGKTLRAGPEKIGGEVQCWHCKALTEVPVPTAPGGWVARVLNFSARHVLDLKTFPILIAGAVVVTAAMMVPGNGCWSAAVALTVVMFGYGELVRRGSQPAWGRRAPVSLKARGWRLALCGFTSLAIVSPWMFARGDYTPHFTRLGMALALFAATLLPLLLMATFCDKPRRQGRLRHVLATVRKHPFAILAALALVPTALVVIEAGLFACMKQEGTFSFVLLDMFPKPETLGYWNGLPYFGTHDFREFPDSYYAGIYLDKLRHGYTFLTALPASLALHTNNQFNVRGLLMTKQEYLWLRVGMTFGLVATILGIMAIQAHWLGLLSTMDRRRSGVSA